MTRLTDQEVIDRHKQSLGEAHRACQMLGKNADPEYLALRGGHYAELKRALEMLEGSARQLAHLRADARWLRLGAIYGRTKIAIQSKFAGQRWIWFGELKALFELGQRRIEEVDNKTGVLGPILPKRASEWLWMPEPKTFRPRMTVH